MIAAVPWSPAWQALLDACGWLLARVYDLLPNYGLAIIVLTVLIRLVLLPLGIRQVRSMQHMQVVQPKVKQIQQKYKGDRTKQQEEIMKLYKEYGVNPFSGCWPVLLQFPILIAIYAVVRFPQHPIHIPLDSSLYAAIERQIPQEGPLEQPASSSGTDFLWMNLLCSAKDAGNTNAKLGDVVDGKQQQFPVDCGDTVPERIPYYLFAVLMFATTYYQQRQMQKASPPGASSQQQQALLKVMPLMFGVFGIFFPMGLVVYWTTSNMWQIGQQYFMLRNRPTAETMAAKADEGARPAKKGFMASLLERMDQERGRGAGQSPRKPGTPKPGTPKPGTPKPRAPKPRGSAGGSAPPPKKPGGSGGGSRKKRPKR
ncbi:MAG: membrane protein insertase YidC [Candidatus Velamenicoccus archaeovorus]